MVYFEQLFQTQKGCGDGFEEQAISQTKKPARAPSARSPEAAVPMARKPFEVAA